MTIECSQSVHSIVATKKSLSKNQRNKSSNYDKGAIIEAGIVLF